MKSMEEIWQRHCRAREHAHSQQMMSLRTQLNTMKGQLSKLRREMADLEAEIRSTEKNRVKEMAREKELMARFQENCAAKVSTSLMNAIKVKTLNSPLIPVACR